MSAYRNDPRVMVRGAGFTVTRDGIEYHILTTQLMGWGIYTGPGLDLLMTDDGPAIGFASADEAIEALIGEPR